METASNQARYALDIGGEVREVGPTAYRVALPDIMSALLMEREVDRASFVMVGKDSDLDPLSGRLYRHLKQQRCQGPPYTNLAGDTQSFRLHSLVDALVAAYFFSAAGDLVPHFFAGRTDGDVMACLDRGVRTRVDVNDPRLLSRLRGLVPSD